MKFNIEIAKILDNHLPANGVGTEREKLRMELMADLLMVVNKLPIHSVSNQCAEESMKWTEPTEGTEGVSYYDHVIAETPIGRMIIEWKSWKDQPSYDVMINNDWVGAEYDLLDAKAIGVEYLNTKLKKLTEYMQEV